MRRLLLGILSLLVLAWIGLFTWDKWVNAHRLPAGPENQSVFFRTYTPMPVVEKFKCSGDSHVGSVRGAVQLIKSIHHTGEFTPGFTMAADRKQELLPALRDDIVLRLRATGATVLSTQEEADGGFTYNYAADRSLGSISASAPFHDTDVHRQFQLCPELIDISFKITLKESWTRPPHGTQWWMAAVDLSNRVVIPS